MQAERARLRRLQRLERLRAIARQTALGEAAQAESTLAQLEALAQRTRDLAAGYGEHRHFGDAASLQQMISFAGGLQGVAETTASDTLRAREYADGKRIELGRAERRRAVVEERVETQARAIAKASQKPILGVRRPLGTALE